MRGIEKSVIFAATLWEVGGVVKSPEFGYKRVCEFPFEVWENDTKRLIITRIGLASSSLAFAWAAQRYAFDEAINIGSVGAADSSLGREDIGRYFDITKVSCIEPYCETHFELPVLGGIETATLATTSRPVSTLEERAYAAKFGRVADMEGRRIPRSCICAKSFRISRPSATFTRAFWRFVRLSKNSKIFGSENIKSCLDVPAPSVIGKNEKR